MKELHFAWVEDQMTEHVIKNDDGTFEWREHVYATEDALQDALWSTEAMQESYGDAIDDAMNRRGL